MFRNYNLIDYFHYISSLTLKSHQINFIFITKFGKNKRNQNRGNTSYILSMFNNNDLIFKKLVIFIIS